MKTARQRAEEFVRNHIGDPTATNTVIGKVAKEALEQMTLSFKEHARDQRHLCAESIYHGDPDYSDAGDQDPIVADPRGAIMNTRAPGE